MLAKAYLRGETLMVLVPGQPDDEMVPWATTSLNSRSWKAASVRFDLGPDGKASAVTFIQPNGNFRAVKKNVARISQSANCSPDLQSGHGLAHFPIRQAKRPFTLSLPRTLFFLN
ncbi:MAG: hypothetical protein IPK21_21880 [Haliscomenobacter sp.]|nr:hypothetical protein [Haliscomenobacter sp.]